MPFSCHAFTAGQLPCLNSKSVEIVEKTDRLWRHGLEYDASCSDLCGDVAFDASTAGDVSACR
jgi:hypothetical protein